MGWKGTLRSGMAIARQLERAERQRANLAAKQYKSMQKQQAFENGQKVVAEYNNYISVLSSLHKEASEPIDWDDVLRETKPTEPIALRKNQEWAEWTLGQFKPSLLDKLLGRTKNKLARLSFDVELAKKKDKDLFEEEQKRHQEHVTEWEKNQRLAKAVLQKEIPAYKEVLEYIDPFSDLKELGSGLTVHFGSDYVVVTLAANGVSVIPDFILSQTTTGKVSKKNMPAGKFNELYQDYICGCVLRIAREVMACLPVSFAFVNVQSELVNTATGHLEPQTILSVAIPRKTLNRLNFESLDPSDAMKNFKHEMKFSKTSGFSAVTEITVSDLITC